MDRKELLAVVKELNQSEELLAQVDEKKIIVIGKGSKNVDLIENFGRVMIKLDDAGLTDEISEDCIDFFEDNAEKFIPKKDAEEVEETKKESVEEIKEEIKEESAEDGKDDSGNEPEQKSIEEKQKKIKDGKGKKKADKKGKRKTESEGKDEFGFGIGTQNNQFMLAIKESPKTMKQIKELPWNVKGGTFYNVFNKLKNESIVDKNEKNEMFII